jgi:hypothetical protein
VKYEGEVVMQAKGVKGLWFVELKLRGTCCTRLISYLVELLCRSTIASCIIIHKGKRHMTVYSSALPRIQPPVKEEKIRLCVICLTVEAVGPQGSTCLSGGDGIRPSSACGGLCRDSVFENANLVCPTCPTGRTPRQ